MQNKVSLALVAICFSGALFVGCAETPKTDTPTDSTATVVAPEKKADETAVVGLAPTKNVVENAIASPDHTTLVAAVKAADLVGTLSGAGPFTVFAPTNDAFTKLPAGTVENLLKPEMKNDLTAVLTYHVVAGAVKAADLKDGQKVKTLNGGELTVSIKDGKVMINGANVTAADVVSSNGVIHVIDAVLLPKK